MHRTRVASLHALRQRDRVNLSMDWITATLISAFMLGCYDLSIKHSVRDNAVLPVLFFANVCSATVWGLLLAWPFLVPGSLPVVLHAMPLTFFQHAQLLLKSTIVACSWICSYFAVKHLPLSFAAPIRATGPMWTLLGAGDPARRTAHRGSKAWAIAITLACLVGLSLVGRREGIHFHRNKWVGFLFAGTLLCKVSGLYDKFLLGRQGFNASTVQMLVLDLSRPCCPCRWP